MNRRLVLVIAASVAATGCCLGVICDARSYAYTIASPGGLESLPESDANESGISRKTSESALSDDALPDEGELAALKPYSPEWWSVRDAIDRDADAKLARKLIICRGCFAAELDDETGRVNTKVPDETAAF
jgi:hypothetical protein